MQIEIVNKCTVRDVTCPAAIFPGAVKLANGQILLHFVAGSDFESSDQHVMQARSIDNGLSWQVEKCIVATDSLKTDEPFTFCCKPTVLENGELITAGYGFFRDRPDMGLSDYATEYRHFPKMGNYLLHSTDNGISWSELQRIEHGYNGLELSGPVLACNDGALRLFATPFELDAPENKGLTFISYDNGKSWKEGGMFFCSKDIAPWEVRSIQLPSGRIMLVIWAFDLKQQKHLNNHIVYSDDGGMTWSKPIDTGLRGQASNWMLLAGRPGILQARREGEDAGIYLNAMEHFDGTKCIFSPDVCIWNATGKANKGNRIEEQFASLKFGQPSAMQLDDGTWLLFFWHLANNEYSIQVWNLKINGF